MLNMLLAGLCLIPLKIYSEDEDGAQSTTTIYVPDDSTLDDDAETGLDDLTDAIKGVTAAKLYQRAITNEEPVDLADAVTNAYDIADKMVLYFNSVEGKIVSISVPAPLTSCFFDSDTVDAADAFVDGLLEACVGVVGNESGDLAESFAYGERQRTNRKT